MSDLLHDIDPRYTVLVPRGILGKSSVIEALGHKVGAVSASSFVTVIRRIIVNAVLIRVSNSVGYIIVVGSGCGRRHHFLFAVL